MEVAAFLNGDPQSWAAIRSAIELVVRSFHWSNGDISRELAQEAMVRLYIALSAGRFRADSSLATYAQNIARHVCVDELRRLSSRVATGALPSSLASTDANPEEILIDNEKLLGRLCTFATLPAESRELLIWIFVDRIPYRDIAARLGVTEGAIKSRVHRLRMQLDRRAGPSRRSFLA